MLVNESDNRSFFPTRKDFFVNPLYYNRAGLLKQLKVFAPRLKGKILDFGCGTKPYKPLFTNCTGYTGLDIENKGFEYEQNSVDVYYDGKTIPFDNEHFDNVFSTEVFEHVFELDASLNEINRVLKTNGKLLITLPFFWEEHAEPYDFCRYSSFGIDYMLEKHGFKILEHEKNGDYITTIYQMKNTYWLNLLGNKNRLVRKLLLLIVLINNTKGFILSRLLPLNKKVYLHNIVLAEKIR